MMNFYATPLVTKMRMIFILILMQIQNKMCWPRNTILITGSSILNGLDEHRMKNVKDHVIKVRPFSGARVNDMFSYITPLLKKRPTYIFLHIGSNDSINKSSDQILDEILKLQMFIKQELPSCQVFLSAPVLRTDNRKAQLTLKNLEILMKEFDKVIFHENIDGNCLGGKGLHLNPKGSGRLAINYLSQIRRL